MIRPDTRHRFAIDSDAAVVEVRLDAFPDGGLARLRLYGNLTESARARLAAEQGEIA